MSDTTPTREGDWSSWVRDHQVCWELKPAQEMVKGHGLRQTGFELKLFGCFDPRPEDDVTPIRRSIHERLRTLVGEVAGAMPVRPLMQVEPPGRVVIPAQLPLVVEVELSVLASPPDPDRLLPPAEVQRLIGLVEDRLRSMGLRKR